MCCGQMNQNLKFFKETKEERDHPACYQQTVQKPVSQMVWRCMSACGVDSLHIWKDSINTEDYIEVLEQYTVYSHPDNVSFSKGHVYFRKTALNHIHHNNMLRTRGVQGSVSGRRFKQKSNSGVNKLRVQ